MDFSQTAVLQRREVAPIAPAVGTGFYLFKVSLETCSLICDARGEF